MHLDAQPLRYETVNTEEVSNGGVSWWMHQMGVPEPADRLESDIRADICIVGGGLTGLWTAHYLASADRSLDIRVVEKEFAGFGASGRNGGWLSSEFPGSITRYAQSNGARAVQVLAKAMQDTVDEVIDVCSQESIEVGATRGGILRIGRSPAQVTRLRSGLVEKQNLGVDSGLRWIDEEELGGRLKMSEALGAIFNEYGVRVNPARLSRGVLEAVRRKGVRVHEATEALSIAPGKVVTRNGTIEAGSVLVCTEGYTAGLPGRQRELLPMSSSMIVTEVVPNDVWRQIGWSGCELVADAANTFMYAQRTQDNRIAWGGRGTPYRFGSRFDDDGQTDARTIRELIRSLHDHLPQTVDVPIAHAWCGILGVPRDWTPSINYEPTTGMGKAGGYVGSGLSTTNLAARTLAELVLGESTERTESLPWVNRESRRWEPEPLRWLGVRAMYRLFRFADVREDSGMEKTSKLSRIGDWLTGRH